MIPSNSPQKPDSAQLDKIKHSIINGIGLNIATNIFTFMEYLNPYKKSYIYFSFAKPTNQL